MWNSCILLYFTVPGSLTVADKEMIVVAVSAFNKCNCCIVIHGAFHRVLSKNPRLADQVLQFEPHR